MIKILYLNIVPVNEKGVIKKINYQIKSLKNNGCSVEMSYILNDSFYLNNVNIIHYKVGNTFLSKLKNKIENMFLFYKIKKEIFYKNIDYVYIRYPKTYLWTLSYYKFLKKINKKIILEVPTYPYDGEIKKENIFTKMDKKYRSELYKYVDKIVTYSKDKEIFGIPCINISNGIDLNEVKLVNKIERNDDKIIFTIVSNCSFWHGIDRFLYSFLEYKKKNSDNNIVFNIVGEGSETPKLRKIVKDNPLLKGCVIFHGFKSGKELDEIYNQTDIGIGSLGIHRIKGLKEVQPLKNREYCAKGLPFVISFIDPDFKDKDFVYSVSNDDENFDIEKIIEWYKNLKTTPEKMREYSKKFSWDIQMKKVIDNI